jgi:hypothetical protein
MKIFSFGLGLVLLAPCFSCDEVTWTSDKARLSGENIFRAMLESDRKKRSDFEDPVVDLQDGSAIVGFRVRGTDEQGYTVVLGKNGCANVTAVLYPHMYRSK